MSVTKNSVELYRVVDFLVARGLENSWKFLTSRCADGSCVALNANCDPDPDCNGS